MIRVDLGPRSYDIAIDEGDVAVFVRARCRGDRCLVVTDENVRPIAEGVFQELNRGAIRAVLVAVPAGEATKSLDNVARLYDQLAELPADRTTPVIAVGGGVVGDLAGFAAATYNRGLPWFMVPTSLLAMVDSSVGGKVGINHARGKNLIGAFHQPAGVWINTAHLRSLPEREFRGGLAEVVKYGVIMDADFFHDLETHAAKILDRDPATMCGVIAQCCRLKAGVVEQDEMETTGLRAILNFGHTFAHAYESAAGYGSWTHGEAVAAGMVSACRLAERLGRIGPDVTARLTRLLERFGLPVAPSPQWPREVLLSAMKRDKKAVRGKLRFILPSRIGHVEAAEVEEGIVFADDPTS